MPVKKKKKSVKKPVKKPACRTKTAKTEKWETVSIEEKIDIIGQSCHHLIHMIEMLTKLAALMTARAGIGIEVVSNKEEFLKELQKMAEATQAKAPNLN